MNETIQEFSDSRGVAMRVDRQRGVIRGVKVLGTESRNGRTYLDEALVAAAGLYEEAKVNVNHPKGSPSAARDYQDRIGVLRNVTVRPGEGLFADFHFNPKHALAEQLIWDAEHLPENVGFSHNVQARTARRSGRVVIEAITKVESVDLVADPATTRGLFESAAATGAPDAGTGAAADDRRAEAKDAGLPLRDATLDALRRQRPDLVEAILRERAGELATLREELDRAQAAGALLEKNLLARRLLSEFRFPAPDTAQGWEKSVVSRRFFESLLAAPDEKAMRELIEERAALVRCLEARHGGLTKPDGRPRSRDQGCIYASGVADTAGFVRAIT